MLREVVFLKKKTTTTKKNTHTHTHTHHEFKLTHSTCVNKGNRLCLLFVPRGNRFSPRLAYLSVSISANQNKAGLSG